MSLASILIIVGGISMLIGWILIMAAAFQENIVWGLLSLFVPFVALLFVIFHFEEAKKGVFFYVVGIVMLIVAVYLTVTALPPPQPGSDDPGDGSQVSLSHPDAKL